MRFARLVIRSKLELRCAGGGSNAVLTALVLAGAVRLFAVSTFVCTPMMFASAYEAFSLFAHVCFGVSVVPTAASFVGVRVGGDYAIGRTTFFFFGFCVGQQSD